MVKTTAHRLAPLAGGGTAPGSLERTPPSRAEGKPPKGKSSRPQVIFTPRRTEIWPSSSTPLDPRLPAQDQHGHSSEVLAIRPHQYTPLRSGTGKLVPLSSQLGLRTAMVSARGAVLPHRPGMDRAPSSSLGKGRKKYSVDEDIVAATSPTGKKRKEEPPVHNHIRGHKRAALQTAADDAPMAKALDEYQGEWYSAGARRPVLRRDLDRLPLRSLGWC